MYPIQSQHTGGELLSKGIYGCVFTPPLKCKNNTSSENPKGDATLTKILSKNEAILETGVSRRILQIPLWKNYFIVAESVCKTPAPRAEQTEKELEKCTILKGKRLDGFSLLSMRFGGVPLSVYKYELQTFSLFNFITHLLEAGSLLTINGIVHRDLHENNIVVDRNGVPRIIDFNISIDTSHRIRASDIRHEVNLNIFQESPDSVIVNAIAGGDSNIEHIIHGILQSAIFVVIEALFNITKDTMREQLYDYYNLSKYTQSGDDVKWLSVYWPKQDSWSLGIILLRIISKLSLWPEFTKSTHYKEYKTIILKIIGGMCQVNPRMRLTTIEALSMFNPKSDILKMKGVAQWLTESAIYKINN